MKISIGVFIFILLYFSFVSSALADDYQCSVTWPAGTYSGKGDSINDSVNDARDNCIHDQELGSHPCGSSPINLNCVDRKGKCVNHATFLKHGLVGGDECN